MSKVIFVTGATSGFGAATARLFAGKGWKVIATGRRIERLEALRDEYPEGTIHIARMDLTDPESIVAAVAGIPGSFRPVTCLFNNGGLALGLNPVPDIRLEDWRIMVETNIMGLINTTQAMVPLLKETGRGASIINISSIAARYPYPGGNVYGASKAFVRQFAFNLRTDLVGTGIRVTSLEPGLAKSEFTTVRTYGDAEANDKFYEGTEPILPEDVADLVWYIATLPAHLNVNSIELMPVCQVPGRTLVLRD